MDPEGKLVTQFGQQGQFVGPMSKPLCGLYNPEPGLTTGGQERKKRIKRMVKSQPKTKDARLQVAREMLQHVGHFQRIQYEEEKAGELV